jgi:hypothetical protein
MDSKQTKLSYAQQLVLGIATAITLGAGHVLAAGNPAQEGAEAARPDGVPTNLVGQSGLLTQITTTVLYIVGIISVFMLIFGGIRYITSGGDSKKVTEAKNTILYAIIGLVIAVLSFAIVQFVLSAIGAQTGQN